MCEFRKLLSHLNKKMALPVCIFTVLNLSYTFSGIIYFIKIYNQYTCMKVIVMGLVNIVLWLTLGLYPFFQVSSLGDNATQYQLHFIYFRFSNFAGRFINTCVWITADVRPPGAHSTICPSQYNVGGTGFGIAVFIIVANECQIISDTNTWELCIFCDIMHCRRDTHRWNVLEYFIRIDLDIV